MNFTPRAANLLLLSTILVSGSQLPTQAQVTAAGGDANTVVTQSGTTFDITGGTTTGSNLFQSFQTFGLNADQIANFHSNPAIQNILGRVIGGDASVINGLLRVTGSNANLYLMNPAGIVFGANATLDVAGSFTATTANGIGFGDRWFNAVGANNYATLVGNPGSFAFTMPQPGAIVNAGNLAVGTGQSLTLLGGTVINTGTLTAPEGQITIAAIPGEKLVRLTQTGSLLSLDLPVETKAALNPQLFNPLTLPELLTGGNVSGATGVTVENGVVTLTGSGVVIPTDAGVAIVARQVSTKGSIGGTVHVLGQKVGLIGATIDASGTSGGGTVLVGGDYQGKGTVPNAQQTYVSRGSVINADALRTGNGGKVIVWADNATRFYGSISARGGSQAGNGGFVEVSGKQNLTFQGNANVSAVNGVPGTVLLDPRNIFIVDGSGGTDDAQLTSDNQILAGDGGNTSYFISETALESLTGEITLEATNLIFVSDLADNRLALNNTSSVTFRVTDFAGGSTFRMEDPNDTIATQTGAIDIKARSIGVSNIATNGGDITLDGGVLLPGDAVISTGTTTPGNITINGQIDGFNWNTSTMTPRSLTVTSSGTVTLNQGIGRNYTTPSISQLNASGNTVQFPNFLTSSVSGNVSISAQGDLESPGNLQVGGTTELRSTNGSIVSSGQTFLPTGLQGDVLLEAKTDIVLKQTQLQVGGALTLRAGRTVNVQDGVNPASVQAGGDLTIQGNTSINLEGYRDPDSRIQSGGNLTLISDGAIVANTRLISGGTIIAQQTAGGTANFQQTVPSFDTIISSIGDVTFGNYEGASLKVETLGSINGGNITILGPNPSLTGSDPDIALLTGSSSLILRAGVTSLQNAPNLSPSQPTGGTNISQTGTISSPGNITVGTIQAGGSVILAAPGNVTTGGIRTAPSNGFPAEVRISSGGNITTRLNPDGPIQPASISASGSVSSNSGYPTVVLSAGGNILTGAIQSEDSNNRQGSVSLSSTTGGVQVDTIRTGSGGITVNAAQFFRAVGFDINVDAFKSNGVVNDPELIRLLVERGFSEEQIRTAPYSVSGLFGRPLTGNGAILVDSNQRNYSLKVNIASADPNQAVINIRIGDASQEIINQVVEGQGRVVILGDSRQPFRLGPVPNDGLSFVPYLASNRLEDYNPATNNFAFKWNASQPLIYLSQLFPLGASGLAGGIAIDDGLNEKLVGSLQYRSFEPLVSQFPGGGDTSNNPNPVNSSNPLSDRSASPTTATSQQFQSSNPPSDRSASPTTTTSQQFQNGEDGQVAQRQLNHQQQNSSCEATSTIAAAPSTTISGTDTRSPRASTIPATNPCASASQDDAQILKILGE